MMFVDRFSVGDTVRAMYNIEEIDKPEYGVIYLKDSFKIFGNRMCYHIMDCNKKKHINFYSNELSCARVLLTEKKFL
jgi:hypothetical protein